MITGLNVGTQPRVTPSNGDSKTGVKKSGARADDQANFADQLLGDKSGGIENQNRNDRKTSGRDSNREEKRSNDREQDSRNAAARPEKQSSERSTKVEPKREARKERSTERTENRVEATRAPGSEYAPIVIEAPKKTEEPEMKLPDFFGKIDGKIDGKLNGVQGKALSADAQAAAGVSVDTLKTLQAGEQLSRQEAMSQFMEQMQSELGISPEKILQALSNLDASVLQAPPEESVGQFIDGLDLLPGNEDRATELYQDLLKKTGDSILNEKVAGLDSSVNFNIQSKQDASLQKLNSSLDGLNSSFFRKGLADEPKKAQAALESMDAAIAKLMRGQDQAAMPTQAMGAAGLLDQAVDGADLAGDDALVSTTADAGGDVLAGLMSANQNPLAAALQSGAQDDSLSFMSEDAEEIPLMAGQKEAKSDFAKELASEDSDLSDLGSDVAADGVSTETLSDAAAPGAAPIASALAQGGRSSAVTSPSDMMMNRQPTSADEQENVRDLIKNAQVLVKRGGGEMNVEMTPEGMGKIQLKVAVENGQVNVSMTTESEQAKRVLEKGMSELRTSLAAHDLKVESMKVDVGNDVSKQMDQQATQDQARQQARNFAQDFMGSFRDERQAFRQGMFEQSGWRSYGRNQRRENMGPEGTSSVSGTASVKSNGDKRLNVVA